MSRKRIEIPRVEIILHQHDMSNFLRCPFKYYISKQYRPRAIKKAINIGDLFAKCVYRLHRGEDLAKCMLMVHYEQNELLKKATTQEQIDNLETSVIIVQSMLFGYESKFLKNKELKVTKFNSFGGVEGFDTINIKQILPEYRIEIPFDVGNYRFTYINRLDGKVLTDTGIWILEIKSTSLIDQDLIVKLNTNFQINSYWFSMLNGEQQNVSGVLYRYIRKPSIRQNKNETLEKFRIRLSKDYQERLDFYFHEECLYFNQDIINSFIKDLRLYFEELTRCYVTNTWVKKGTACDNNFGLCEYLRYCSDPTEETLRTYYETT